MERPSPAGERRSRSSPSRPRGRRARSRVTISHGKDDRRRLLSGGVQLGLHGPVSDLPGGPRGPRGPRGATLYGVSIDPDRQPGREFRESLDVTIPMLSDAVPQAAATRALRRPGSSRRACPNRALVIVGPDQTPCCGPWEGEHPGDPARARTSSSTGCRPHAVAGPSPAHAVGVTRRAPGTGSACRRTGTPRGRRRPGSTMAHGSRRDASR